jgi:sulfur-oxidizing protein SoxA
MFLTWNIVAADPDMDRQAFVAYFQEYYPDIQLDEYVNGVYAYDAGAREQWQAIEEFPPYEYAIDEGKKLFKIPFQSGNTYSDCFPNGGIGIRQNYPYFDTESGQIITLELAINQCRERNGEPLLPYLKGEIVALSAYMAFTSRGKKINIVIPDDPLALAAYEEGKRFFYSRRGQLNFSCYHCHMAGATSRLRAHSLSPALGHTSHFPVYRSQWEDMGSLHRRYTECNKQTGAKPLAPQSREYRHLEFFHTFMSNGLEINGPGARR